jgi:hypothetical protein
MSKRGRPKKDERVEKVLKNYKTEKSKHLERLATELLKRDEVIQKLKGKKTKGKFLDLF